MSPPSPHVATANAPHAIKPHDGDLTADPEAVDLAQQHLFALPPVERTVGRLNQLFGVPPFSILDTRQGYWIDRKREWLGIGLRSELGRGEGLTVGIGSDGTSTRNADHKAFGRAANAQPWTLPPDATDPVSQRINASGGRQANAIPGGSRWPTLGPDGTIWRGDSHNRPVAKTDAEIRARQAGRAFALRGEADVQQSETEAPGTSIFDPVLCELTYHWYTAEGGLILDPFAGGSVRGIVAAYCGRPYVGVDLRPEQVAANEAQWAAISEAIPPPSSAAPQWITGDSRRLRQLEGVPAKADLLFTCPPYYDLEIYSDDPDDLSRAATYDEFMDAYLAILLVAADRLADNRFAVLVVSEIRDKKGIYRGFVPDTIRACADAGLDFYNEATLLNRAGSLPLRAGKQFAATRKLGRSHQAVLTFVKGDGALAAQACGPVRIPDFGGA